MALWTHWVFSLAALGLITACGSGVSVTGSGGSTGSSTSSGSACVPGMQVKCGCPGGDPDGVQVCNAEGSAYGACSCTGQGGASSSSSGGGMADAGPVSPDQIPGLSLWLDSAVGKTPDPQNPVLLKIWADQSAHGNNAKGGSSQQEPLILTSGYKSFDVIRFSPNGSSNLLSCDDDPSLQFGTGEFTIAMVLSAATQMTTPIFEKGEQGSLVISVDHNVNVVTPTAAAHAYLPPNAWHVVLVRGPALEIRVDGAPTKGTTNTTNLDAVGVPLWMGALSGNNQSNAIDFLQIIAYKGKVTDAQAAGLERHLKDQYGL